ncbi:MAG TPA: thiamine pyrophosphate-binding protein, partial [Acidimicrobiia bacterium]|nr:thiamine pyrophosphate-binding protein [Acidimicrobiia bacterium]
ELLTWVRHMAKIHGGQIIARALRNEGVDTLFTLTGGHIVPILDGCLQEDIRIVDVRHEQTAAHAAEAYTRLTGKLGVAAVTAGPGVTDTVTGVATAYYGGTPMLAIGGRHLVRQELKGGLQEMDHTRVFHSITKWAATAWQVDRLADYISTAARHAFAGRGGPVFLDVPMDVQFDMVEETAVRFPTHYRQSAGFGADEATLAQIIKRLKGAEKVMIFAGASSRAVRDNRLADLAEVLQAPTYVNSRARGSLLHGHPLLGNHVRSRAMAEAEVVLALGVDWDFRTSYGDKIPHNTVVIQIDGDATKVGWNRPAQVAVVADPMTVVSQLVDLADEIKRSDTPVWTKEIMDAEAEKQAAAEEAAADDSSPVMPQRFAKEVAEFFGTDSIVSVDGGDIVSTTARWLQISTPGHVLDPGPFGTLGTGAPYAIAAKTVFPDKTVGIVFGDGGFGFNGMEYDTMVRLDLPIIGVVGNDGVWSNIKTFHRMAYPDRLVATDLGVRPYHEMVKGLGGYGEFVDDPAGIQPALERAKESGLPSLINVHIAETMRMSSNYSQ